MSLDRQVEYATSTEAQIEYAKKRGVELFDREVSAILSEHVINSVRHFHFSDDANTLCNSYDTTSGGEPGYSQTCKACSMIKRAMCAARREEGKRRARAKRAQVSVQKMNADFATMFDAFDEEAGPPHFDNVDDAVLSRQLKRRAVLAEQDGDGQAAYYLREAARRIDMIYDYKG